MFKIEKNSDNYSPLLYSFIQQYRFSSDNLNQVNHNGVTPLTLAIEQQQQPIILELLSIQINPFIENIHGNSPLSLAKNDPWCLSNLQLAKDFYTCQILDYKQGAEFNYADHAFTITKIMQGGAGSLGVMQITSQQDLKHYFAKVKKYFGGLEIRNYMFLEQYVDLFKINNFIIIGDNKKIYYREVYCLIEKQINGQLLSEALVTYNNIDISIKQLITQAIYSLCNLHIKGYIHYDPLLDNCIWDPVKKEACFIDYESMRKNTDPTLDPIKFEEGRVLDLEKLIFGGSKQQLFTKFGVGLNYYYDQIEEVINEFDEILLPNHIKSKLTNLSQQYCQLKLSAL